VIRAVTPRGMVHWYRRLEGKRCLQRVLLYSPVHPYHTARRHIADDSNLSLSCDRGGEVAVWSRVVNTSLRIRKGNVSTADRWKYVKGETACCCENQLDQNNSANNQTAFGQGHVAGYKMLGTRAYFVVTRRLCTSQVNTTAGWGYTVESSELIGVW
jgi:hypothetical protein